MNTVLGMGCFPLVPFSNRIADSRFLFEGRDIALPCNHPGDPSCHAIHGTGWLSAWEAAERSDDSATMRYRHSPAEWPWAFEATQTIALFDSGFDLSLAIENCDERSMPVGLGFHPYFPRNEHTILRAYHSGEWQNDAGSIPIELIERAEAADWWEGRPVQSRTVDTVYTGRQGPVHVEWPDRGVAARLTPSNDLPFTTVYVPANEGFFCAEPVSHMTDAFNRDRSDSGMRVLGPGESWQVSMRLEAFTL